MTMGKDDAEGDDEEGSCPNEGKRLGADGRIVATGGWCRRWVLRTIGKRLQGPISIHFPLDFGVLGD